MALVAPLAQRSPSCHWECAQLAAVSPLLHWPSALHAHASSTRVSPGSSVTFDTRAGELAVRRGPRWARRTPASISPRWSLRRHRSASEVVSRLMRRFTGLAFTALAVCFAGCGNAMIFSCKPAFSSLENSSTCVEYANGWTWEQARMFCGQVMSIAEQAHCSRANVIGGCRSVETTGFVPRGATTTIWFASGAGPMLTPEQVSTHCASMPGYVFVRR